MNWHPCQMKTNNKGSFSLVFLYKQNYNSVLIHCPLVDCLSFSRFVRSLSWLRHTRSIVKTHQIFRIADCIYNMRFVLYGNSDDQFVRPNTHIVLIWHGLDALRREHSLFGVAVYAYNRLQSIPVNNNWTCVLVYLWSVCLFTWSELYVWQ